MLSSISISNYALIDQLDIDFGKGFNVITGETGAGKSILLGGLALVLGKRADLSSMRDKERKCVVEAHFEVGRYGLKPFFKDNDLDYETPTIIRREILPSGKSRAFVNDSPVTLDVLSELGSKLIDVHSQHQTMELTDNDFQMQVVDALAGNGQKLEAYTGTLAQYKQVQREAQKLRDQQAQATKEYDYNSFLLQELQAADLRPGTLENLEEQYGQLSNMESILEQLSRSHGLLNEEQLGILARLADLKQLSHKLSGYGQHFTALDARINSVFIELDDIGAEVQNLLEGMETDPAQLEEVNGKLQLLYALQKKHQVQTEEELVQIREDLAQKVDVAENMEAHIQQKEQQAQALADELNTMAQELHQQRKAALPKLKEQLEAQLKELGMPNAGFNLALEAVGEFMPNGKDTIQFLFSANKGMDFGPLKKVASGGELSRIMLVIKAILAQYDHLPTMMFDEIDTGVSGEVSKAMAQIMHAMGRSMQVFSITHLPQVASKGDHHFKVYKEDKDNRTLSMIKELSQEERVVELAEMLGGKQLSDSALAHARQLLN